MKVAYCNLVNFSMLKPDEDTVIVFLVGVKPDKEKTSGGWKKFFSTDFKVLEPFGQLGSFREIDDQALELADNMFESIDGAEKVIVVCQHGEIRSRTVATGISFSNLGDGDIYEINSKGKWVDGKSAGESTFSGRTYSIIAQTIDLLIREKEAISKDNNDD